MPGAAEVRRSPAKAVAAIRDLCWQRPDLTRDHSLGIVSDVRSGDAPGCTTGYRRREVVRARAAQIDAGFDVRVLADMIATLDRFTDSEIPVPDGSSAAELRAFCASWRSELAA